MKNGPRTLAIAGLIAAITIILGATVFGRSSQQSSYSVYTAQR